MGFLQNIKYFTKSVPYNFIKGAILASSGLFITTSFLLFSGSLLFYRSLGLAEIIKYLKDLTQSIPGEYLRLCTKITVQIPGYSCWSLEE